LDSLRAVPLGHTPDATALIFFSGYYGIQSNRQNYLVPINAFQQRGC
jgi:hypothetical protein